MATILREERYVVRIGSDGDEHILLVQELVAGSEVWPNNFCLQLPAAANRPARIFYGQSANDVAREAADFLAGRLTNQATSI